MSITVKRISTHKLGAATGVCTAGTFRQIRGESPAVEAMTDFALISAATISGDLGIEQTNALMIARGVRLLFVTDSEGRAVGLVSARDLLGEKPVQISQARGQRVNELTVADLMCPVADIDVISFDAVMQANVSNIVETLRQLGRQHMVVEDHDPVTAAPRIRGIFSATQIGRQLGVPVQGFDLARTFAEIKASIGS